MTKPTEISSRHRPVHLTGLPARIRVLEPDPGAPLEIRFELEPYDVPEGGAELRDFPPPAKPSEP